MSLVHSASGVIHYFENLICIVIHSHHRLEFFVLMPSLYRSRRQDELQNYSSIDHLSPRHQLASSSESRSLGVSSCSTKESRMSLEKKLKDLNISTSYIPGETDSDKTDSPVLEHSKSVVSLIVTKSLPQPARVDSSVQTDDLRKTILSRIGLLYDAHYLTNEETAEAISLAMQRDDTCELMASLLNARNTFEGQGQFMKMWIDTRIRQKQQLFMPPQSVTPFMTTFNGTTGTRSDMIFRPKPVYCSNPRIDTPEEDISQISLQTMVRSEDPPRPSPAPNPSPPLFPTSLQFNDPVFQRSHYQQSLVHYPGGTCKLSSSTPSSCSTSTPLDPLLVTMHNNSIGDNHGGII